MIDCELIGSIADIVAMISGAVVIVVLYILTAFNTYSFSQVSTGLFTDFNGVSSKWCTIFIMVFGYLFIACSISLIVAAIFTDFFETRLALIFAAVTGLIGVGALASTCAFFAYVRPDRCNLMELKMIFALFRNITSPSFEEWKHKSRCSDSYECTESAHKYVNEKCRIFFTSNLVFTCLIIALVIIGVICTAFGQFLGTNDD